MTSNDKRDIFIRNSIYPDPQQIFSWQPKSLDDIKNDCLVVLDTNVLLVPYNVSGKSLEEVGKVYRRLAHQNRLRIPGQVAREFAPLRAQKIGDLLKALNDKKSQVTTASINGFTLLESLEEYRAAKELQDEINDLIPKFHNEVSNVVDRVRSWGWNDPVSVLYTEVFAGAVVDVTINREEMEKDFETRRNHKIPPGYKDAGKEDGGVGDMLIWRTILHLGSTAKQNVLFVTGDDKSDWWHRASNAPFHPRTELVEEFRRHSEGKTFHMVSLADLLELFNANEESIREVQAKETDWLENVQRVLSRDQELRQKANLSRGRLIDAVLFDKLEFCLSENFILLRELFLSTVHIDAVLEARTIDGHNYVLEIDIAHEPVTRSFLENMIVRAKHNADVYSEETRQRAIPVALSITFNVDDLRIAKSIPEFRTTREIFGSGDFLAYAFTMAQLSDFTCGQFQQLFPSQ